MNRKGTLINFLKLLFRINFKTIYFNFKYLKLSDAIKLPILISKNVSFRKTSGRIKIDFPISTGMIQFGYNDIGIFDKRYSRSIWEVSGLVVFRGNCRIGHGSKIVVGPGGILTFGNNFLISAETSIISFNSIEFGDNCLLSWDILFMDTDFHHLIDEMGNIINMPKRIIVGNNVWIGCRSLVLKGSIIPDNCVIGANSLVNRSLDCESCLYVGVPCKLQKKKISWKL
jgi:acetyltransferase-like isoleucine patch superfamily enzyme